MTLWSGGGIFGVLVILGWGGLGMWKFFGGKKIGEKNREMRVGALSFLWFFGELIPVMGLVPLNTVYAERFLYLPIIGILILLGFCIQKFWSEKSAKAICIGGMILVFVLGARTTDRNRDWVDVLEFYKNEIKYNENSPRINHELGVAHFLKGNIQQAVVYYKKTIELMPEFAYVHYNLANAYMNLSEVGEGYITGVGDESCDEETHEGHDHEVLGAELMDDEEIGENETEAEKPFNSEYVELAIQEYYKAIELNPDLADAYKALYQVYFYIVGDKGRAEEVLRSLPDFARM
jgi:hypothetical protein